MAYAVNLSGPDLAAHLAIELTDVEFELLIRARVKAVIAAAHERNPNLGESHDKAWFYYSASDKCTWNVGVGETYSKKAETEGEVLSHSFRDAEDIMLAKSRNKLSLLLAGPEPDVMVSMASTNGKADHIPF